VHELVDLIDDGLPLQPSLAPDLDHILYLLSLLDAVRKTIGEARWNIFRQIFIDQRAPAKIAADERLDVSQVYDLSSYFRQQARDVATTLDNPPANPTSPDASKNLCKDL
jgi:hypothetical protein